MCLLSAATDGQVAAWTPLVAVGEGNESAEDEEKVRPVAVCQVHQSGINDMSIQQGE